MRSSLCAPCPDGVHCLLPHFFPRSYCCASSPHLPRSPSFPPALPFSHLPILRRPWPLPPPFSFLSRPSFAPSSSPPCVYLPLSLLPLPVILSSTLMPSVPISEYIPSFPPLPITLFFLSTLPSGPDILSLSPSALPVFSPPSLPFLFFPFTFLSLPTLTPAVDPSPLQSGNWEWHVEIQGAPLSPSRPHGDPSGLCCLLELPPPRGSVCSREAPGNPSEIPRPRPPPNPRRSVSFPLLTLLPDGPPAVGGNRQTVQAANLVASVGFPSLCALEPPLAAAWWAQLSAIVAACLGAPDPQAPGVEASAESSGGRSFEPPGFISWGDARGSLQGDAGARRVLRQALLACAGAWRRSCSPAAPAAAACAKADAREAVCCESVATVRLVAAAVGHSDPDVAEAAMHAAKCAGARTPPLGCPGLEPLAAEAWRQVIRQLILRLDTGGDPARDRLPALALQALARVIALPVAAEALADEEHASAAAVGPLLSPLLEACRGRHLAATTGGPCLGLRVRVCAQLLGDRRLPLPPGMREQAVCGMAALAADALHAGDAEGASEGAPNAGHANDPDGDTGDELCAELMEGLLRCVVSEEELGLVGGAVLRRLRRDSLGHLGVEMREGALRKAALELAARASAAGRGVQVRRSGLRCLAGWVAHGGRGAPESTAALLAACLAGGGEEEDEEGEGAGAAPDAVVALSACLPLGTAAAAQLAESSRAGERVAAALDSRSPGASEAAARVADAVLSHLGGGGPCGSGWRAAEDRLKALRDGGGRGGSRASAEREALLDVPELEGISGGLLEDLELDCD
uniref:Uncharacterized protein n=1 Tax=Tetraselmis sp. GSL018 TaxID=582737 RepID=A0A061QLV9_9CHLO